jgi:anti-anti-sigma factor
MDFIIKDEKGGKRVILSGQFTFADNNKFKEMMEALNKASAKTIVLDFADVNFIDSGALGMLLLFRDEYRQKHIRVSLEAARGQVEKIFTISKFDQLFSGDGGQ